MRIETSRPRSEERSRRQNDPPVIGTRSRHPDMIDLYAIPDFNRTLPLLHQQSLLYLPESRRVQRARPRMMISTPETICRKGTYLDLVFPVLLEGHKVFRQSSLGLQIIGKDLILFEVSIQSIHDMQISQVSPIQCNEP